jgi:hypothetical protein
VQIVKELSTQPTRQSPTLEIRIAKSETISKSSKSQNSNHIQVVLKRRSVVIEFKFNHSFLASAMGIIRWGSPAEHGPR